jgi:hypothetical protein
MSVKPAPTRTRSLLSREAASSGKGNSLTREGKQMSKNDDFSGFFLSETSVINLDLPNGEPMMFDGSPVRVHVYSPATSQYTKANDAMQKEAAKRLMASIGSKSKKEAEDKDADAKFLVAITDHFENFPYPGGADAIYREPKLKYVADQVRTFVGDAGNFFGIGAKV